MIESPMQYFLPTCTYTAENILVAIFRNKNVFFDSCTVSTAVLYGSRSDYLGTVPGTVPYYRILQLCMPGTAVGMAVGGYGVCTRTVRSLKHPWSSPENFRFRRCRRSNLDQNLPMNSPRITNPVSDLTGD
jgi:hypothetical protein